MVREQRRAVVEEDRVTGAKRTSVHVLSESILRAVLGDRLGVFRFSLNVHADMNLGIHI